MSEKLCVFCSHFKMEAGCADTYGYGGEDYMTCAKDAADFYVSADGEDAFRKAIITAQTCKHFRWVKS